MSAVLPRSAPLWLRLWVWFKQAILVDSIKFSGRTNRLGFAMGFVVWLAWGWLIDLIGILGGGSPFGVAGKGVLDDINTALGVALLMIPFGSLIIRRLHDIDREGWAMGIICIPYIGILVLLGMMLVKGNADENAFGPPPGPVF